MVVQQAQAVQHAPFLEFVNNDDHFIGREAEDGSLAAGFGPVAAGSGGELAAHAELGTHVQHPGAFQNGVQLAGHFDDKEDIEAQALCLQTKVYELAILVAVADKAGFPVRHVGHGSNELALGAHFQAVMVARAEIGNLFYDLLLLIDLDGKDTTVAALVAQGFDGLAEGLMEASDLRIQDVFHTQKAGHVVAALLDAIDDLGNGYSGSLRAIGTDDNLAFLGHIKVSGSPGMNAVQFGRILNAPGL